MGEEDQLSKWCEQLRKRPRNVRFKELLKVMQLAGFEARFTKSGHGVLFWHGIYPIVVSAARPHKGTVLEAYVWDCLAAIDEIGRLEEESDA